MVECTLWERDVAGSSPVSPIGEFMIIEPTVSFTAFNYDNCWILTREKIASSWLIEQFNYIWINIEIDTVSYEVTFDDRRATIAGDEYNKLIYKFLNDWNELKLSTDAKSNFIFLTRNPIHRFISGWVQDNIMSKIHFLDEEHSRLLKYFHFELVDKFIDFVKKECNEPGNTFPDVKSIPEEFSNIYEEFCFPRDNDYFNSDLYTYFYNLSSNTHTKETIFFLWQLMFTKPFVSSTNLHFVDIDLEDIKETLYNKFNINFRKEDVFSNTRSDYLKNKAYAYLAKNASLINPILYADLFIWFEIVRNLYFKDEFLGYCCGQRTYDMKTAQMLSKYKKKYNIPSYLDVFDINTHINWYRYLPPIPDLEYV